MTISPEGLPVFVEAFWKSGVALGAALCINVLLRKKSADVRRLVLSTVIAAMFVAAVTLPLLPQWSVAIPSVAPVEFAPISVPTLPGGSSAFMVTAAETVRPERPESSPRIDSWVSLRNRMPGIIPLIWLLGTTLLLVRFAISLRGLRRLRNASDAVSDISTAGGRRIALLQNDAIAAPVTWGVFRPVILVPTDFGQLPVESRNAVLCHELAHVQGYDFFLRGLAEIARAVIWFQPLMWIVWRQLREEQELACDNRVLAEGGRASAYARMLLDWNARPGVDALIAVGITHRGCLKRRLYALLDQDLRREQVAGKAVVATWFVGLATALPLAAISFSHAIPVPPPAPVVQAAPAPVDLPALMKPASAAPVQVAQVGPAPAPPVPPPLTSSPLPLPRFSTMVVLVRWWMRPSDANGKNREDLKAGDFVVTEDGVAQDISVFDFQKLSDASSGLGSYYILGYYSTNLKNDGSYRRVKIAVKDDATTKLDSRAGYYTDRDSAGSGVFMVDGVTCQTCTNTAGPGITFPVLISQKQPEYSEDARRAKYSGTVTLQVEVDASGNVAGTKLIKRLGMGLDEKAIEAVAAMEV